MTWWIWLLFGLALLGAEALTPGGFFVLFFGVGALAVGGLVGLDVIRAPWIQWILFSLISIVSLLIFRRPLLRWIRSHDRDVTVDALEGEVAVLLEDLAPGGVVKAELRGTAWNAQTDGDRPLAKGQRCRVVRVDGLTLWVRAQ